MSRELLSESWHRVRALRPRLRPNAAVHRQVFRDRVWYVLEDRATGQFWRFSPETWAVVGALDGRRTVDEIWRALATELGDDLPTQDEVVQLLGQLHRADALAGDVPPVLRELDERARSQRRARLVRQLRNPLFVKVPLLDPDAFLRATVPLVGWLFTPFGLVLWTLAMAWAGVQVALEWEALSANTLDRVLLAQNVALLVVLFPPLKLLHELGHGWAVRRFGGEVHEIGVMLLVFMPIPYVEASAASAFGSKWQRITVAAAGMMAELLAAAAALWLWRDAEPGLLRAAAFNVMLIAGVSTVLFNGNPLLRFDAYYILADLLEIPNLATRAPRWWGRLFERRLFGVRDDGAGSPADDAGEAFWLAVYAPTSFAWRLFLLATIALFVAEAVPLVGPALALWTVALALIFPAFKVLRHLLTSPRLEPARARAIVATLLALGAVVAALTAVPLPHATVARGVVWAPEAGRVLATENGFVDRVAVAHGDTVADDAELAVLRNDLLAREVRLRRAQLEVLARERAAREPDRPAEARLVAARVAFARADLDRAERRLGDLVVRAPRAGEFRWLDPDDMAGRFFARGELMGYVFDDAAREVRVVVPGAAIDLVRSATAGVDLRLERTPHVVIPDVEVAAVTPASDRRLPHPALAASAGGPLARDPAAGDGARSLEPFWEVRLQLPDEIGRLGVGERVRVRFDHGMAPVAVQLWRFVRRTFLERFER
jgi:putative peptide zinc metalloprotease protein